jgi:hypothetical protein
MAAILAFIIFATPAISWLPPAMTPLITLTPLFHYAIDYADSHHMLPFHFIFDYAILR